jgi:hypothetical protein
MATWNEWFISAKEKKVSLEKYLCIDQPRDLERLYSSGFPCSKLILISGSEYNSSVAKEFFSSFPLVWTRIIDKFSGKRRSMLRIKSFNEFCTFVESLDFNLPQSVIQLYEMEENALGGNVITNGDKTLIEIIFGDQDTVAKSREPFFHGKINSLGRLEVIEKNVPMDIFEGALKVLSYLKKSRNSYLEGYFEFVVSDKGNVFFLDYKIKF